MNNLVSVIIPYYDKKNYFFKCISSVLHQTHKNLEIIYGNNILINDINAGNPDNKDVFLAFSQDDNINIMTSFMAKDIFQIKKVICGIQNLSKAESLKSANFQIVNISQIVINSTISII